MYFIENKNKKLIFSDTIEKIKITLDENSFLGLVNVKELEELKWPEDFKDSFQNPIHSKPINQLTRNASQVAIIVSDSTPGIPTSKVMPIILDELQIAGISLKQILVVIALGVHRPATEDEINEIIGKEYANRLKIVNHDPYNENKLIYLETTSFGTPVEVNKMVYHSDFRITIGKVEAHEFAGFSGGRKSVLPGISSEKTIRINHSPEMILKNGSIPGQLENNPINEDMIEAAKMLGIHFGVNFVLNATGKTVGLFTGDLFGAHKKAIEFVNSFCK
jgi:nickel-dependent lactate racemase